MNIHIPGSGTVEVPSHKLSKQSKCSWCRDIDDDKHLYSAFEFYNKIKNSEVNIFNTNTKLNELIVNSVRSVIDLVASTKNYNHEGIFVNKTMDFRNISTIDTTKIDPYDIRQVQSIIQTNLSLYFGIDCNVVLSAENSAKRIGVYFDKIQNAKSNLVMDPLDFSLNKSTGKIEFENKDNIIVNILIPLKFIRTAIANIYNTSTDSLPLMAHMKGKQGLRMDDLTNIISTYFILSIFVSLYNERNREYRMAEILEIMQKTNEYSKYITANYYEKDKNEERKMANTIFASIHAKRDIYENSITEICTTIYNTYLNGEYLQNRESTHFEHVDIFVDKVLGTPVSASLELIKGFDPEYIMAFKLMKTKEIPTASIFDIINEPEFSDIVVNRMLTVKTFMHHYCPHKYHYKREYRDKIDCFIRLCRDSVTKFSPKSIVNSNIVSTYEDLKDNLTGTVPLDFIFHRNKSSFLLDRDSDTEENVTEDISPSLSYIRIVSKNTSIHEKETTDEYRHPSTLGFTSEDFDMAEELLSE